ncbi:recombinase family protein [Mycolicibacterium sp. Dal123E01]|uniref:recombinase family protein n=1 Tax=Mycolicibacterium sp. Dal123E01 TaxID=3457578 RepID=UPI00403EA10E
MTATLPAVATSGKASRSNAKGVRTQQDSRRAAIYARVSKDHTGEATSVDQQEEAARDLIDRRGWELAGVYVDNSITGTGKKHRPQFYEMLAAVRGGEVDAIVARHMDRIARNPRERLELVEACKQHGVIIALVEGSDMDPTTASGRLVIGILGEVAEMEIGIKGERHTVALERHARAGKVPHGPRLFGYTAAGGIDPKESIIVRDIFERFYAGESLRSLARLLDETKVTTRSGRPWNTRTVRDMLTNVRYAGWAIYQGKIATDHDGQRVRGQWEPLIAEEVFEAVQARLTDPSRTTNRVGTDRRYIGSSLYLCATCDAPVTAVNGGKYFCSGHLIRDHKHVDEFVLDVVAARLAEPNLAELLAAPEDTAKPILEDAKRLRAKLDRLKNDYFAELIDAAEYKEGKERVNAELREIDKKLATRKGGAALGRIAGSSDPAQTFLEASLMAKRSVIEALVAVRLHRQPKGRMKRDAEGRERINPATVDIQWRR